MEKITVDKGDKDSKQSHRRISSCFESISEVMHRCVGKSLSSGHSEFLLSQLNEFRKSEQFTDVILKCGDVRIPAHRNVLAASSYYFAAMFSGHFPESSQSEISLQEMDAHCVELLVEFIYTGQLRIEEDCVQHLLVTASFLQLGHAEDLCAEFMAHHLDPSNCLGFKHFGEKQNNVLLLKAAKEYTIMHFQEVVKGDEFLEMSYTELAAILSNDELYMHSDDTVLINLVRWAEQNPDERIPHLGPLVRYIHPACVSPEVANSLSILQQEPRSSRWLDDVKQCIGNVDWRIFVLDKMGQWPQMQSFDLTFEIVTPLKPLPRPAFAVSLAGYRNILYVQGGSLGRSLATSYYYNIYRDQWYDLKPLEMERSHHRSVVLHENLYAIGGNTLIGTTATMEWQNLATTKSALSENMSVKRSSMGAAASDEAIYVMGGETDHRSLYSAECYDPRVGRWMELPSMSMVNSYCSSALIGGTIYCCEGLGSCMERFDLRANKWQVIDFWEEREFYEIFAVEGKLFSVSGKEISRFDVDNNRWITAYKFPDERDWDTAIGLQMVSSYV